MRCDALWWATYLSKRLAAESHGGSSASFRARSAVAFVLSDSAMIPSVFRAFDIDLWEWAGDVALCSIIYLPFMLPIGVLTIHASD